MAAAGHFLAALAGLLALHGIGRSLWLDEAWVANSAISARWHDVFYYKDWLQTTPPLFLVLVRGAVRLFGLSNSALRAVPFGLFCIAGTVTFRTIRSRFGTQVALLATSLVVLNPVVLEYARTTKQYSGELAASALLLWMLIRYEESAVGIGQLVAAAVLVLAASYSAIFLIPGLIASVVMRDRRDGVLLAASSVLGAAGIFGFILLANYNPALRDFWQVDAARSSTQWLWVFTASLPAIWVVARSSEFPAERGVLWICGSAPIFAAGCAFEGFYPATPRTFLFVLPLAAYAIACFLDTLVPAKVLGKACVLLTVVLVIRATALESRSDRALPFEDGQEAVAVIRKNVQPGDLVLVHPSMLEQFRLYSEMAHWSWPNTRVGNTGWPCCVPGRSAGKRESEQAVRKELESIIPKEFHGTAWLLYTTRPPHWDYVGMNQGELWRKYFWERGCPPGPYVTLANVAVSPMRCAP
jgi:hypothetical protein